MITASTLQKATREELLEMFLRYMEESQQRITQLEKRVAELEDRGKKGGGAPLFKPSKRRRGRKPGRKEGHEPANRPIPTDEEIDETLETRLDGCPDCGGPVEGTELIEKFVEEIIPARTVIRKHVNERGYCACCDKWVQSRHAGEISNACGAAGVSMGPRALALAAAMKNDLRVSFRKIAWHFEENFGLKVTHGALAQGLTRLGRYLEPVHEIILGRIRASESVNVDETGWRVESRNAWMWVATNKKFTAFEISYSRGGQVARALLAEFSGVLGCDGFSAYTKLPYDQQKCLVHILRELAETSEKNRSADYQGFHRMAKRILKDALRLKARTGRRGFGKTRVEKKTARIEARMEHCLNCVWTDKDVLRIAKTLKKHQKNLFRFLRSREVEGHNNSAERALRPRVIQRKTCGGNRSEKGARATAVIASVLETFRKNGLNFVETVAEYLRRQSAGTGREYISALLPAPGG